MPGTSVTLIDIEESRRVVAAALGVGFARVGDQPGGDLPQDCDLVFHVCAALYHLLVRRDGVFRRMAG